MANNAQQYQRPGAQPSTPVPAPPAPPASVPPSGSQPPLKSAAAVARTKKLSQIIAALAVVDVVLIITAIALLVNALAGPSTPHEADSSPSESVAASEPVPQETAPTDIAQSSGAEKFATPTGNIICSISAEGATCSIAKLNKKPKKSKDECEGYVGYVVELRSGEVTKPCVTEANLPGAANAALPVLDYDQAKQINSFKCTSKLTGMECKDLDSGKGFSLARAGIKTF